MNRLSISLPSTGLLVFHVPNPQRMLIAVLEQFHLISIIRQASASSSAVVMCQGKLDPSAITQIRTTFGTFCDYFPEFSRHRQYSRQQMTISIV